VGLLVSGNNPKKTKDLLASSGAGIAEVLSSFANERRLQLLAMMIDGPRGFEELQNASGLSKTALANHLKRLLRTGVVRRLERGTYALSEDGLNILSAIGSAYSVTQTRRRHEAAKTARLYSRDPTPKEGREMDEFEVKSKAKWEPSWTSYVGAVTGILKSLGVKAEMPDVGGYTGYAFLVNVAKSATCPSAPTCHTAFGMFAKAVEKSFGWKIGFNWDNKGGSYPSGDSPTPGDLKRAKAYFEMMKKALRQTNRPIGLWGLVVPEFYIVNGYKGDRYLASTMRECRNEPEEPLKYNSLHAPGGFAEIVFKKETKPLDLESRDKQALQRAVRVAEGKYVEDGYVQGLKAFDTWAQQLKEGQENVLLYHGNSYVGACTLEALEWAAQFLKGLSKRYKMQPQDNFLNSASKDYSKAAASMKEFTELFPFGFEGDFPKAKRKKGAKLLESTKPHVSAGVAHMKKALSAWK
jgi:DNA-binding transcriptional ArsR family regulator